MPAAITAAFSSPGSPWRNRRPRPGCVTSALAFRSTLTSRSTGSSITRRYTSIGGRGCASRPRTPRSTETFSTRAPSGKSMPRKKMSLQPLCDRSIRTGVRSHRIGKQAALPGRAAAARWRIRSGWSLGMPDAEHPLVAAHRADAAAHLVGQGLKPQLVIGGGQGAGRSCR